MPKKVKEAIKRSMIRQGKSPKEAERIAYATMAKQKKAKKSKKR